MFKILCEFENVRKCSCCHHPVQEIIQNHLWDWKHFEIIFLKQLIVQASLSPPLSFDLLNFEIYSFEAAKTSTWQSWRKHWDLLFWIDLTSTWKLPTFIHSCSFEVSWPIFSNPSFQFLWEFWKIGKYSLGKYSEIPIIHLSVIWEKVGNTAYWTTF